MVHVVSFPGLGLEFTLNRVAFEIFGRPVYWYGIIIACGLLLAVYLCSKWAPRFGVVPDHILDLMIFAVPAALIAIRAYYVIFNLDLYKNVDGSLNWEAIFRYSDGGLAIYGAIISSAIVLLIFCHVRKVSFLAFADLGVHGLFIGQLIGRWGNFMNVEAYGGVTDLPWRMCSESIAQDMLSQGYVDQTGFQAILDGTLGVHPTFFYESAWNVSHREAVAEVRWGVLPVLSVLVRPGPGLDRGPAHRQPVLFRPGAVRGAHPGVPDGGGGVFCGGGSHPALQPLPPPRPSQTVCEPPQGPGGAEIRRQER